MVSKTGVLFICSSARVSSFSPCKFLQFSYESGSVTVNSIISFALLASIAPPCSIQPVELLKDTGKLLLWYGIAVVPKADHRVTSPHLRRYGNFGVWVAIKHSITQQVIKNPLDLMAAKKQ